MWKKALKSRTMWLAGVIAGLGALQVNIDVIPKEYQGETLIAIAFLVAVLRVVTTMPLDEK
jgi:hypothetical protein